MSNIDEYKLATYIFTQLTREVLSYSMNLTNLGLSTEEPGVAGAAGSTDIKVDTSFAATHQYYQHLLNSEFVQEPIHMFLEPPRPDLNPNYFSGEEHYHLNQ